MILVPRWVVLLLVSILVYAAWCLVRDWIVRRRRRREMKAFLDRGLDWREVSRRRIEERRLDVMRRQRAPDSK
jgi:hypothetical protein